MHAILGLVNDYRKQPRLSEPVIDIRVTLLIFAVLCSLGVLILKNALVTAFAVAFKIDAYTHILLIFPISFLLLLSAWRKDPWRMSPSIRLGLLLISISGLIGIEGSRLHSTSDVAVDLRLSLEMLSFVIWVIGAFVLCFGKQAFRACMFPLLFLAWLIPLPSVALTQIIHFLQQGTVSFAHFILVVIGIPVAQDGTTLTVPGLTLQIAQECSSIRSSMLLIVSSVLMSYLFLRSTWGRGAIVLASIPLAIAKNGLRVFTLAVLGAYFGPAILNSPLHHQGGVLFLAIALVVVILLIWLVGKIEAWPLALPFRGPRPRTVGARQ